MLFNWGIGVGLIHTVKSALASTISALFTYDMTDGTLESGQTFSRASTAYHQQPDGTWVAVASGEARFSGMRRVSQGVYSALDSEGAALPGPFGLLMEPAETNYLLNSATPATQTTGSLGTGTYCLWVEGTGSAAVTAGTATIAGGGTASAGAPNVFNVTGSGTVTVTVTGTLTKFQVNPGSVPSSFILTAGSVVARAVDTLSISGVPADNETRITYADTTTADINDWNGTAPTPTAPVVISKIEVYAPYNRPGLDQWQFLADYSGSYAQFNEDYQS